MAHIVPDSQSRYKTAGKAFSNQITPAEVPKLVQDLRNTFNSEKTFSYEYRIEQLKNLKKLLIQDEKALCEAMYGDLRKSHFEGFVTEVQSTLGECDLALSELKNWMKPEKKGNTPLTFPSTNSVQRDPLGVVLVMGAWNYPIYLSLNPVVGAIAGGNCVVLKPGSYAVNSSNCLAKLLTKYMDPACVRVVEGNRNVTQALLKEKFDMIFFTGSGFVGKVIARAAAEHLTPCVLELGGKSPCIVDKSAKQYLEHAAKRIAWGAFVNGGQTCVRPDFVLVHEDIADEFNETFKRVVRNFYSEDPSKSDWFARCINDAAFKRISALVDTHRKNIVVGGAYKEEERYIEPTLFNFGSDLDAFAKQEVMHDEIFGPLVPSATFKNIDQVVKFVRNLRTGKPLALYAFGTDPQFIEAIKTRTTAGGVSVNDVLMHLANHDLPFGGVGASGMGNYHGKYSFDTFTHAKAVLEKNPVIDELPGVKQALEARWPPYDGWKQKVIRSASHPILTKLWHLPVPSTGMLLRLFAFYLALKVLGFKITRA